MEKIDNTIPKIFISYSWKPLSNKNKVNNLAERLTNDGIHVIIDDWDLKEGQDKYHFMEQMVNDNSVNKVLLICNKEYAEKANKKIGGVGIESLIVSDDIYNQADQTKFIPIVMEYDENGKPCVPTFVNTRIFIDLSNDEHYDENYDKLIRNIYNKPKSKRPPIGKMPIHLNDDEPIFLPTAHKVSVIKNALINNNPNANIFIKDYLDTFLQSLISFKLNLENVNQANFIEEIEKSIDALQVLKNDFIEFVNVICKNSSQNYGETFFNFLEGLFQFYSDNDIEIISGRSMNSLIFDNFKFFNYDLFLSLITILLSNERFNEISYIVKNNFIITSKDSRTKISNFNRFRTYNYTLNEFKNQNFNPKRVSVVADNIKKYSTILKFDDIKKVDIILYYLSLFYPSTDPSKYWFPETSCYNPFDIDVLPKIISKRYFDKIKIIFDVQTVEQLKQKIENIVENKQDFSMENRFYYTIPDIKNGLHYEDIGKYN